MPARLHNIPWLNANGQRNYPLDDLADRVDDDGGELSNEVLSDLHLWFPDSLGKTAFISSITLSKHLVTATFCAHDTRAIQDAGTVTFTPLAAVTVKRPVVPGKNYALQSFVTGAGGWISFGDLEKVANFSHRFSSPAQTSLLPRVVRAYHSGGVTSMGKPGVVDTLTGVVKIRSANPDVLIVEKGSEVINGVTKECVVFRLNEATAGRDIYKKFIGPCGGTPESITCNGVPIHSINGATPFCDGVIEVFVREEVGAGQSPDMVLSFARTDVNGFEPQTVIDPDAGHTLDLDYGRGMGEICPPRETGFVNDKVDNCDDPCRAWDTPSPLQVICFSWHTGLVKEPFYDNGKHFMKVSHLGDIDMDGQDSIVVSGSSDDITLMIPADSNVNQNPSDAAYSLGRSVTFAIPANAIMFGNTSGWLKNDQYTDEVAHLPNSAEKTITNGSNFYVIDEGSPENNATGQVSELASGGFVVHDWNVAFTRDELYAKGFIDADNHFRFKFVHIVSGWGFANVLIYCNEIPVIENCEGENLVPVANWHSSSSSSSRHSSSSGRSNSSRSSSSRSSASS